MKDPIERVLPQPNYYVEEVLHDKKQMRILQQEALERDKHARDIQTFKKVEEKAKERLKQEKLKAQRLEEKRLQQQEAQKDVDSKTGSVIN